MQLTRFLKLYIPTFLTLFFGNFLTHGLLFRTHNDFYLKDIVRPFSPFNMQMILLNYLILTTVMILLFRQLRFVKDLKTGALTGAIFGGILFLNLGLSNVALLPIWPLPIIITDTIASAVAFGAAGTTLGWLLQKEKRHG